MSIRPGDKALTWEQRFWTRVEKTDTCWLWRGGLGGKGGTRYGIWNTPTGRTSAHRVSWILLRGHLFDHEHIDHLCGNTLCVRPDHLEPVSPSENRRRQRERLTHCKYGHELSGGNLFVDSRGHRGCVTCRRRINLEYSRTPRARALNTKRQRERRLRLRGQ